MSGLGWRSWLLDERLERSACHLVEGAPSGLGRASYLGCASEAEIGDDGLGLGVLLGACPAAIVRLKGNTKRPDALMSVVDNSSLEGCNHGPRPFEEHLNTQVVEPVDFLTERPRERGNH